MNKTDLSLFRINDFSHGKNMVFRLLWIVVSRLFFETRFPYPYFLKSTLLKLFGAKVGIALVIKPSVKIKQPWLLKIENNCWIGENVWIDNLVLVSMKSNVCLSQGAFLFTGNHNYKKLSFDLITGEIYLEDGVWIGAKAIVGPGVTCNSHSVLSAGSTTFCDLQAYGIYQGNIAELKRKRIIGF